MVVGALVNHVKLEAANKRNSSVHTCHAYAKIDGQRRNFADEAQTVARACGPAV
jgi:hypothetical protein